MAGKLEIQWSPNKNKFITWGSEVCLYEIEQLKEQNISCTPTNTRYIDY